MFGKKKETAKPVMSEEQQEHIKVVTEASEIGGHSEEDMKSYAQLSYYAGNQWIAVSKTTQTIVKLPKEEWQSQYTANRIMPAVRTELAKTTRFKLGKRVIPASMDDEDIRAAQIAEKVTDWLEYELNLQEIDEECTLWALATRIGFVKPVWNEAKGPVIATKEGKPIAQGDPDIEVLNMFELKWDPAASRWGDIRWAIHERQRTVEYVKAVYGMDVPEEDGLEHTSMYDVKIKNISATDGMTAQQGKRAKGCVVVKEYWEAPNHEYPKGRRITVANDVELFYEEDIGFGPEDNTEREIPIFPLIHIPVPGKIIGSSIVEQLMPVQREYNTSRSQVIENQNLMANPKWLAQEGSIIGDYIDSEPGTVVWYRKGFDKPDMVTGKPLGSEVYKNIEACLEEFMFISGQQEVSHGTTPSGVTSGVAIELLQNQDDTKLAPTIAKKSRHKQAYMSYLLKMVRFNYTEERTVQLVGENRRLEALSFKGSDLTSTDIRMEDMSLTQLSQEARKQYIIELVNLGVLNPELDKDVILRALELGITDELYDAKEIDVQQAINENAKWSRGEFDTITREFFNHEVHVAQHNRFRKSEEYDELSAEAQTIVDQHVEEHMAFYAAATVPGMQAPADVNMDNVVGALDPAEQQALQQNPEILDTL